MKDRIPTKPGRVLLTPEDGSSPFYATITRADEPTQNGDPLDKNTLLKNETAALYGLDASALPDEVFALLKTLVDHAQNSADEKVRIESGSYVGTGTYGADNPCSLTFDTLPKMLILFQRDTVGYKPYASANRTDKVYPWFAVLIPLNDALVYVHLPYREEGTDGISYVHLKIAVANNTVSWYWTECGVSYIRQNSPNQGLAQFNYKNTQYYYYAIM